MTQTMDAAYFKKLLEPKTTSQSMLKTRSSYLAQLYRSLDSKATDLSFLNDTRSVLQQIRSSDNVNTQKTRIFHVIALLKLPAAKVITAKNKKTYENLAAKLRAAGNAAYAENIMSDKQKDRYMSLDGLNRSLERSIIDLFNRYSINRSATISDTEFTNWDRPTTRENNIYTFARDMQQLVIFACYAWQPSLRNDYGSLEITRKAIGISKDRNWLQIRKNGDMFIHMNEFKNVKSFGKRVIEIKNPKLKWIIKYWIDLLGRILKAVPKRIVYYTINANHTIKLNEDPKTLSRQIPRISEKITGKPLSVNDFRHIWEADMQNTEEYKRATIAERTKMHEQLLHGHTMGVQYNLQRRDGEIIED